jgi:hypothetical protein
MEYKFKEDELIAEFADYVDSTYTQHYGQTKFQANEVIIDRGNGLGFALGNVDKYLDTPEDHRKDLLKMMHYTLIALSVVDKNINAK